jgi:hypothetical protein
MFAGGDWNSATVFHLQDCRSMHSNISFHHSIFNKHAITSLVSVLVVVAPVDLVADLERLSYFGADLDDRADVVAAHDAEWFRERAIEGTFLVC